jgi:hypothetical protein
MKIGSRARPILAKNATFSAQKPLWPKKVAFLNRNFFNFGPSQSRLGLDFGPDLTRNVDFTGIFAAAGVHDNCVRGCFASFEPETRGAGRSTSHFLPFAVDRGPASRGRCLWPFDSKLLCGVRCVRPHGLGAGRRRSDQQSSMLGNSISSPVTSFRGPSCFAPL